MAQKRNMESTKNCKRGHWSLGLKNSMEDPELIVESDDEIIIIKDKFPKAKYHFLVLPRTDISSLKALKREHVDLLKHMHEKGKNLAEKTDGSAKFKFGYHAVPSMSHLHLHVISQDLSSPCLKTKKHWNSFTTEYFIDSSDIIQELETKGFISTISSKESEELLKKPLKCHICAAEISNLPKLKTHVSRHLM